MKALSSIFLIILLALKVSAQTESKNKSKEIDSVKVKFNFLIAKSSDNTYTKSKSGEFKATFPESDSISNSWLTDAFIEIGIIDTFERFSLGATYEIHKNTLIEKKQDVRQFGGSFIFSPGIFKNKAGSPLLIIPMSLTYKNSEDFIKEKQTGQLIFGLTLTKWVFSNNISDIFRTNDFILDYKNGFGECLNFDHNFNIGFSHLGKDENFWMFMFDYDLNVYLPKVSRYISSIIMDEETNDMFKFGITTNNRKLLNGETDLDLNNTFSYNGGIKFSFSESSSFEIGYTKYIGADPLKGKDYQKYSMITFKAKINLNNTEKR